MRKILILILLLLVTPTFALSQNFFERWGESQGYIYPLGNKKVLIGDLSGNYIVIDQNVISRGGNDLLKFTTSYIQMPYGMIVGAEAYNNMIDDSVHGTGSTTLYIGNKAIAVDGSSPTFANCFLTGNLSIKPAGAVGDSSYVDFTDGRASVGYDGVNGIAYLRAGGDKSIAFFVNNSDTSAGCFETDGDFVIKNGQIHVEDDLSVKYYDVEIVNCNYNDVYMCSWGDTDFNLFYNSASGENKEFSFYGYITAASSQKRGYIKVDDSDDYIHMAREDSNILGLKVDMPLVLGTDTIVHTGTSDFYTERFKNDADTGWYWDNTTSRLIFGYDGNSILEVTDITAYVPNGIAISAYDGNNVISSSSFGGGGSTTLYIGDYTIDVTNPSDERCKENIQLTRYGLPEILALNVVDYNYKAAMLNDTSTQTGLIAQEVEKVIPEAVAIRTFGVKEVEISKEEAVGKTVKSLKGGYTQVEDKYFKKVIKIEEQEKFIEVEKVVEIEPGKHEKIPITISKVVKKKTYSDVEVSEDEATTTHTFLKDKCFEKDGKYYRKEPEYTDFKQVDYKKLVPVLIKAVQELSSEVEALKAQKE